MEDPFEYHHCPECGNACPPRMPEHGPTTREIVAVLDRALSELYEPWCEMAGYPGSYQGYSTRTGSASCRCRMWDLYRQRYRLIHPEEEEEEG